VQITLSFDNGPYPETTPRVLDILAGHGVLSTFFLIGSKLDADGLALARTAHERGHRFGNHTWTHSRPLGTMEAGGAARHEILDTQERLGGLADASKFFRPVGGGGGGVLDRQLFNEEAIDVLVEGLFTVVLWNVVPRDWERPHDWVEVALAQCREQPESLVVLHDSPNGAMDHLDEFIDRALGEGAEFVQEFPVECTPLINGIEAGSLREYVTAG
jgi:peptidoglycan/xylan/chitin deacetylase (PgdA/CDA1 family)